MTTPTDVPLALSNVPDNGQELLRNYSGLQPEQVATHVQKIRDRASQFYPGPCISLLRFLSVNISSHPLYTQIINTLKTHPTTTFLDAGCCVGQDLRHLALHGVPQHSLYGTDISSELINIGFNLFLDRESFTGTFVAGDLLSRGDDFSALEHRMDIIHASSLLHLFTLPTQLSLAERLVGFSRPVRGSLIVGFQAGSEKAGEQQSSDGSSVFIHDPESFRAFWDELGRRTETKWRLEAELVGPEMQRLVYTATRL